VPPDEQRQLIASICAGERWILDTAYTSWLDVVLDRVQLIVGRDYPRWRSLGRLVWRTVRRNVEHQLICNGNTESFRRTFSRDSIIAWQFKSFAQARSDARVGGRSSWP
jgi:hypothetical protein